MMLVCCTEQELRAFSLGELSDSELDRIGDHLETCSRCAEILASLDGLTNPMVETLRREVRHAPSGDTDLIDPSETERLNMAPEGRQLGPYRIIRQLGSGGMGVVYEAEHRELRRRVALKVVRSSAIGDAGVLERFRREARAAARLHHTNIVPVFDVGEDGKISYFAMQLIDGLSLDRVIARCLAGSPDSVTKLQVAKPASPGDSTTVSGRVSRRCSLPDEEFSKHLRWVATVGRQAASALAHAHFHGIIHRDIKPSNLLADSEGTAWVTDFGLAMTEEEGLTKSGDLVGTLRYLAPERFLGECDARADVYSLGLTLYELACFRPAFESRDRVRLMEQIQRSEPEPLRQSDPRIPRDLETIIHKAADREPARRYSTAAELADDLGRFLAGEPIKARPLSRRERLTRWANRNPVLAWVAVLGPALMAVATAVSLWFAWKADERATIAADATRDAREAERVSKELRHSADLQAAELLLQSGIAKCQSGSVGEGLHILLDAWRLAPADAEELRRGIRRNLAAWRPQLPLLRQAIAVGPNATAWFLGKDGGQVAVLQNNRLRRLDAVTGEPAGPERLVPPSMCLTDILPDPPLAAILEHGVVRVENLDTGEIVGKPTQVTGAYPYYMRFTAVPNTLLINRHRTAEQQFIPLAVDYQEGTLRTGAARSDMRSFRLIRGDDGRLLMMDFPDERPRNASDFVARFTDFETGEVLKTPPKTWPRLGDDPGVAWNGRRILSVTGSDLTSNSHRQRTLAQWWDATTGKSDGESLFPGLTTRMTGLGRDGATLSAVCPDEHARVFDLVSGLQFGGELPAARVDAALGNRMALHPVHGGMALPSNDGILRVWGADHALPQRTASGQPREGTLEDRLPSLEYHGVDWNPPTRSALFLQGPALARVIRTDDRRPFGLVRDHDVGLGAFRDDGKMLATVTNSGWVKNGINLSVIDNDTGDNVIAPRNWQTYGHSLAFSPDRRHLAVGGVGGAKLVDLRDGTFRELIENSCGMAVAFSPDGSQLAVGYHGDWGDKGGGFALWDVATGKRITKFLPFPERKRRNPLIIRYAPDGQSLLTICCDRWGYFGETFFQRHDARTGQALGPVMAFPRVATAVALRPDGKVMAAALVGGRVVQMDVETGELAGASMAPQQTIIRLAYSPDGQWLAMAGEDHGVRWWEADTGRPVGPAWIQRSPALDICFDSTGNNLMIATRSGALRTWNRPEETADTPETMEAWIRSHGGITRSEDGGIRALTLAEWNAAKAAVTPVMPSSLATHHRRAGDAEEDGEPRAALWRLERMRAEEPTRWLTRARIGRIHACLGDEAAAARAYDEAERLARESGDLRELLPWYVHQAAIARVMKEPARETWYAARGQALRTALAPTNP